MHTNRHTFTHVYTLTHILRHIHTHVHTGVHPTHKHTYTQIIDLLFMEFELKVCFIHAEFQKKKYTVQ